MGCLLAVVARVLLAFGEVPKTIWGGVTVGAVVALIMALVKGDWRVCWLKSNSRHQETANYCSKWLFRV